MKTENTLMGEPTKQLAVRLPTTLVDRIEAHVERMKTATPGVSITRVDALRALLLDGLSRAEAGDAAR